MAAAAYPPAAEHFQEQSACLYLLRHGPTVAPPGCLLGSTDLPLSGQGLNRLAGLLPQLRDVEHWHCSPMLRARQTLDELRRLGCRTDAALYDQRLREIDFGAWEMKGFAEIAAIDPARVQAWQEEYEQFAFPGGEAVADFVSRARAMLADLAAQGGSIGAVTHGGVIRTMICLALGLPPRSYLLFDVRPASLTVLELFSGGGVLRGLNL
ncbi:histidine phosphatase family protein [Candidatus Electronema sp. TJ]|uniref:histidine phosphatase family protein n=1 Tax=Candidatus Electronema sp. TJ TaxID=3401573 RepID=UPI003AA7EB26